jgi:hypothetical protein
MCFWMDPTGLFDDWLANDLVIIYPTLGGRLQFTLCQRELAE